MTTPKNTPSSNLFKFSYGLPRGDATNYNGDAQKAVTSNSSSKPIKSGEVFRTECGQFSFVCTTCFSVWRNCDLLIIHIDSHFKPKKQNIEKSVTPFAAPEFVSVGEVKIEPGEEAPMEQNEKIINGKRLTPIIGPSGLKLTPIKLVGRKISKLPTEKDRPTSTIATSVSESTPTQVATGKTSTLPTEKDRPTSIIGPSVSESTPIRLATSKTSKLDTATEIDRPTSTIGPSALELTPMRVATGKISKSSVIITGKDRPTSTIETSNSKSTPIKLVISKISKLPTEKDRPTSTIVSSASESAPIRLATSKTSKLATTTEIDQPASTIEPIIQESTAQQLNTTEISKSRSTTTRIVRVVQRTNDLSVAMALLKNVNSEANNSGDKSTPNRTKRILKVIKRKHSPNDPKLTPNTILKLKRMRLDPSRIGIKKEPSTIVDLTSDLDGPVKIENSETSCKTVAQSDEHSNDGEGQVSRRKIYAMRTCYQCEMEPKVQRPSDPRRHRCALCPVYLPNHDEFYRHVKDTHDIDPGFVSCQYYYCYACKLRYAFRQNLTAHVKSHLTEANLCAICGMCFETRKKFMVHMEKHCERKYKCEHCGKAFKRLWVLRQHLLCHNSCSTSHVCHVCSKAFKFFKYLKRHMAVHDEPKISCRHCDAKFRFVSVRRAHEQNRHGVM